MKNGIEIVNSLGKPIVDCDLPFREIPRKGDTIKLFSYIPGDEHVEDGKIVGTEWFSQVDRINYYKVIDVEYTIKPTFNNTSRITVKIYVTKR